MHKNANGAFLMIVGLLVTFCFIFYNTLYFPAFKNNKHVLLLYYEKGIF